MRRIIIILLVLLASLVAGCGPSEEEIATQTAAAWTATPSLTPTATHTSTPTLTPTPTPTLTPTPIPFDLTVLAIDANGNPIHGASIVFLESGDDEPVTTDNAGQYAWFNLSGDLVSLAVSAQGYSDIEESTTIERGANEITITLERDPLQLLPAEACQPGQEVLYLEDFESGQAQDWGVGRPAWTFEDGGERGTILVANAMTGDENWIEYNAQEFGNIVWHLDMRRTSEVDIIWFRIHRSADMSYIAVFLKDGYLFLQREGPNEPSWPGEFLPIPDGETWEHLSIAYFDGAFDVWIDDQLILGVDDSDPFEKGTISIAMASHDEIISFDNFVVCGLNEPYTPPPKPEPEG